MSKSKDRKDFSESKVHRKFLEQDGVCATQGCNNPLSAGFHRNHISGDASDNTYQNLELLCLECHFARKDVEGKERINPWEEHKKVERECFRQLNDMINKSLTEKFSGATMERIIDAETLKLKISRREKGIDKAIEYPPPSIKLIRSLVEQERLLERYMDGWRDAIKSVRIEFRGKKFAIK